MKCCFILDRNHQKYFINLKIYFWARILWKKLFFNGRQNKKLLIWRQNEVWGGRKYIYIYMESWWRKTYGKILILGCIKTWRTKYFETTTSMPKRTWEVSRKCCLLLTGQILILWEFISWKQNCGKLSLFLLVVWFIEKNKNQKLCALLKRKLLLFQPCPCLESSTSQRVARLYSINNKSTTYFNNLKILDLRLL